MYSQGPGPDAVKLAGGPPGTTTFVYIGPENSLVIELYDHGQEAESHFGHDVAFLIHVAAEHKPRILELLRGSEQTPAAGGDPELFGLLRDRFCDYYEVERWLDANGIPYRKEFDSWA